MKSEKQQPIYEVKTRTSLANEYKVSYNTFKKMLSKVEGLELNKDQRVLTPKQVKMIYAHLGQPDFDYITGNKDD